MLYEAWLRLSLLSPSSSPEGSSLIVQGGLTVLVERTKFAPHLTRSGHSCGLDDSAKKERVAIMLFWVLIRPQAFSHPGWVLCPVCISLNHQQGVYNEHSQCIWGYQVYIGSGTYNPLRLWTGFDIRDWIGSRCKERQAYRTAMKMGSIRERRGNLSQGIHQDWLLRRMVCHFEGHHEQCGFQRPSL